MRACSARCYPAGIHVRTDDKNKLLRFLPENFNLLLLSNPNTEQFRFLHAPASGARCQSLTRIAFRCAGRSSSLTCVAPRGLQVSTSLLTASGCDRDLVALGGEAVSFFSRTGVQPEVQPASPAPGRCILCHWLCMLH